jgi:hypothetical protein
MNLDVRLDLVTTNKEGFILSSIAFCKNIYDGHSLSDAEEKLAFQRKNN